MFGHSPSFRFLTSVDHFGYLCSVVFSSWLQSPLDHHHAFPSLVFSLSISWCYPLLVFSLFIWINRVNPDCLCSHPCYRLCHTVSLAPALKVQAWELYLLPGLTLCFDLNLLHVSLCLFAEHLTIGLLLHTSEYLPRTTLVFIQTRNALASICLLYETSISFWIAPSLFRM